MSPLWGFLSSPLISEPLRSQFFYFKNLKSSFLVRYSIFQNTKHQTTNKKTSFHQSINLIQSTSISHLSPLTTHNSQLTTHNSQLITHYSPLPLSVSSAPTRPIASSPNRPTLPVNIRYNKIQRRHNSHQIRYFMSA